MPSWRQPCQLWRAACSHHWAGPRACADACITNASCAYFICASGKRSYLLASSADLSPSVPAALGPGISSVRQFAEHEGHSSADAPHSVTLDRVLRTGRSSRSLWLCRSVCTPSCSRSLFESFLCRLCIAVKNIRRCDLARRSSAVIPPR